MNNAQVSIVIRARDEASAVLGKMKGAAQGLAGTMGGALKVGGLAAAGGLGVAAVAVGSFVKKAAEEQVGITRLQTAIGTLDAAHRGSADAVETLVRSRERLAFSDDSLRDSLSLLIPATGDYEEAVRRQKIAMDVARGTGLDLATTSRLLGKVNEESVDVFKRYGITIKQGATEQEALAEIQRRFAGQSEAYAQTAAGKWALFNNQMDNVKETIGAALLPIVTRLGASLSEFLLAHQDDIERFANALGEKIPKAINGIADAIERARPFLEYVFENVRTGFETIRPALAWIINNKPALVVALTAIGIAALLAFTPITLPILAVVAALGGLLFVIGVVRNHWEEISGVADEVWTSIAARVTGAVTAIRDAMSAWGIDKIVGGIFQQIRGIVEIHMAIVKGVIEIAMALIRGDWGAAWGALKEMLAGVWDGIKLIVSGQIEQLKGLIRGALQLGSLLYDAGRALLQGLIDGIESKIEDVMGVVKGVAGKVKGAITGALGIHSPSTVFRGYGENVMDGFVAGILSRQGDLGEALDAITAQVEATFARAKSLAREHKQAFNVVYTGPGGYVDADGNRHTFGGALTDEGLRRTRAGDPGLDRFLNDHPEALSRVGASNLTNYGTVNYNTSGGSDRRELSFGLRGV